MARPDWRVFVCNNAGLRDFPSEWLDDALTERCTMVSAVAALGALALDAPEPRSEASVLWRVVPQVASFHGNAITEMSPILSCRGLLSLVREGLLRRCAPSFPAPVPLVPTRLAMYKALCVLALACRRT